MPLPCPRYRAIIARRPQPAAALSIWLILYVSVLCSPSLHASSRPAWLPPSGGFLELGIESGLSRLARVQELDHQRGDIALEFSLSLNAAYRRGRFFFEMTQGGFDGVNIGATLMAQPDWSIDLLLANIAGQIREPFDDAPAALTEADRERDLVHRDTLYVGSGLRATRHVGDALMQVRWISDLYAGHGHIVSARLGQQWQAGNWNLQAYIGAEYHTRRLNDYLFGIDPDEATARFPTFQATSGQVFDGELGATLPLGRNWVFDSRVHVRFYPDELRDSPLLIDQRDVIFTNRVNYVF